MVRTKEIQEWAKIYKKKNQIRYFCFVVGPVVSFRSIKKNDMSKIFLQHFHNKFRLLDIISLNLN